MEVERAHRLSYIQYPTTKSITIDVTLLCVCAPSVGLLQAQMDAPCHGAKKPEDSEPQQDPRPPAAKLARLEQNGATGPSVSVAERSRQGSPGAKAGGAAQKVAAVRLQGKSWHSRGKVLSESAPGLRP